MTQQKERWIAHNQKDIPKRLKPETLVRVAFENGATSTHPREALWWFGLNHYGSNIIGYQIVEQEK